VTIGISAGARRFPVRREPVKSRLAPWRNPPSGTEPDGSSGMQAILLASSLLLVAAMIGSLVLLPAFRVPAEAEATPAEAPEEL
jgi:hypothetical protein